MTAGPDRTPATRSTPRSTADRVTRNAGSVGNDTSRAANTPAVDTPSTTNAARHPNRSPMNVPAGTPSTDPSGTAANTTAVATPTRSGRTSRAVNPTPIDQNAPMTNPTNTRDTATTQ